MGLEEKKKIDLPGILIAVALLSFAFILLKPSHIGVKKVEIKKIANPILPKNAAIEKPVYDIDKVRPKDETVEKVKTEDLGSVYKNYPEDDTGGNIVEAWSRVSPEEKAKFTNGIDKEIISTRKALEVNPEDKKAKARLKISESLKRLAANNFNYKARN